MDVLICTVNRVDKRHDIIVFTQEDTIPINWRTSARSARNVQKELLFTSIKHREKHMQTADLAQQVRV